MGKYFGLKPAAIGLFFWIAGCAAPSNPTWSPYQLDLGIAIFEMMVPSRLSGDFTPFEEQLDRLSLNDMRLAGEKAAVVVLDLYSHSYDGSWPGASGVANIHVAVVRKGLDETVDPRDPEKVEAFLLKRARQKNVRPPVMLGILNNSGSRWLHYRMPYGYEPVPFRHYYRAGIDERHYIEVILDYHSSSEKDTGTWKQQFETIAASLMILPKD